MTSAGFIDGAPAEALRGSLRDFRAPAGPDLLARCDGFVRWRAARREGGTWPFARVVEAGGAAGPGTSWAVRDEQGTLTEGLNFASPDHLNLSSHPAVVAAAKDAIDAAGLHAGGSAAPFGTTAASVALEGQLAALLGMDEALLAPSGWAAGFGAMAGLVREGDLVLLDEGTGGGPKAGARAATRNVATFRHLDVDHCRLQLRAIRAKHPDAGLMVATEGLFAATGDAPDLAALRSLAHEHRATLLVDASHDLGALGPDGTGQIGLQGMDGQVDLVVGGFSRAFGSNGGFVAMRDRAVKDYLRVFGPPWADSDALSPAQVAAVAAALAIVRSEEGARLRDHLMRNALMLRGQMRGQGLEVRGEPSGIVAVRVADEALARLCARELPGLGLFADLVEAPAVPRGEARIRLQVMARHSADEVEAAAERLAWGLAMARRQLGAGAGAPALSLIA